MSWLEQHIEEFVMPVVGDEKLIYQRSPSLPQRPAYFLPEELTVMKNAWRSIKSAAKGQTIFLPGRDVWLFEVLARRENYPTLFMPECSRNTVRHIAKMHPELAELFMFDTGFAGSIPKNMQSKSWGLLSADMLINKKQIFPRLSFSRAFALKIEDSPKYWESGRMVNGTFSYGNNNNVFAITHEPNGGISYSTNSTNVNVTVGPTTQIPMDKVLQPQSHFSEFIEAARLTIEVYTNSAPKFINRHKPITTRREGIW